MSYNYKQGWYKLVNPSKYIVPIDEHMQSTNLKDCSIKYKSSLELKFIKYCDLCPSVTKFSLEPFPISYFKPTDKKYHRYYPDFYLEYGNSAKVLVEIKSESDTKSPIKPNSTLKDQIRFKKELANYMINQSKWKAAKRFAEYHGFKFLVITDKNLQGL